MESLALPGAMRDEMVAHVLQGLPNEACGVLVGMGGRPLKHIPTRNSDASPVKYNIHPEDLVRIEIEKDKQGWEYIAFYHSHTFSEAYPSTTDVRLAFWPGSDMLLYPDALYIVISLRDRAKPEMRAFHIKPKQVQEVPIQVEG